MIYITGAHCICPLIRFQCLDNFISESKWSSMSVPCYYHFECAATRRVARTQWVTVDRQTWASISSVPWAQIIGEKKPGGSPWETRAPPPTTAGAKEAMDTTSLLAPPAGIMATTGSPPQDSPTSGKTGCPLLPLLF